MGQKIHPQLFRLGITAGWQSRWFDTKNYAKYLLEDFRIRELIVSKFKKAVTDIEIERFGKELNVNIHSSRPGMIIGRGGSGIEEVKKQIRKLTTTANLSVNILEIKNPETVAGVVANGIVEQIEKRIPFRRAMKQAMEAAKQARVDGIRIVVAGRLNGAEIARTEALSFGKVPLHSVKFFIDYASKTAYTTYGTIGVKVWITRKNEEYEASQASETKF